MKQASDPWCPMSWAPQHTRAGEPAGSSKLGYPTSDEHLIAGGYVSDFQGTPCGSRSLGHIFSSQATGAREVHGCIDDAYIHPFGGPSGFLGFPTTDEKTTINSGS